MREIFPLEWKHALRIVQSPKSKSEFDGFKNTPKIIVGLAADYGNLGDVAITYAQKQMLSQLYPNHLIIEIPISKTLNEIKALKNICNEDDIITTVGGGNMGDLYWDIELHRQLFFKNFKNNKIISFPQTIDFSNTLEGKKKLKKTQKVYNSCKHLTLLAREEITFNKMKELFPNAIVLLTPDIVMTLDEKRKKERNTITLCLRNDKELNLSETEKEKLVDTINKKYQNVIQCDTHIGRNYLTLDERDSELKKIWDIFASSKVVVTDRLHGMIFCYITQTPCVALQNNNHKVKGCYEWIKDCGYIHLCETNDVDQVLEQVAKFIGYESVENVLNLNKLFKKIIKI